MSAHFEMQLVAVMSRLAPKLAHSRELRMCQRAKAAKALYEPATESLWGTPRCSWQLYVMAGT